MGDVVEMPFRGLFNRARMWLAGVTFGGRRDLYELFGYKRYINHQDFTALYYRNSLAKRINDQPVVACWADPPQLVASNPEFNEAWAALQQDQVLWHKIMRLDKLAGLGQYAIMVVGFDDGKGLDQMLEGVSASGFSNWTNIPTGQPGSISRMDFQNPVKVSKKRKILYLQPYHQGALQIIQWETDTTSPRFGQPVMYSVNPGRFQLEKIQVTTQGANAAEPRQPFRVHWSRVIHIAENMLEDGVYGTSRLEAPFNDINDMMKISGGSAELFWTLANRGMQIDVDKEMDLSPEDAQALQEEVDDYQHDIRRFIRTRGVEIKDLGSHTADPSGPAKVTMQMIAAGTGMPQQVLAGSAAGQIASHQDRANYADRIAERIAEYAGPIVLKRTIDCFVGSGALPAPQNLIVTWPEAFKLNPLERAQTSAQMARSAANLTKSHVAAVTATDQNGEAIGTPPLFTTDEMRRIVSFGKHPPVFDSPTPTGSNPVIGADPDKKVDSSGETSTSDTSDNQ